MDRRRRRLSPLAVDSIVAAGVLVLGLVSRIDVGDQSGVVFLRQPDGWNALLICLQAAPLALRRRYPVAVLTAITLAWSVDRLLDYPPTLASAGVVIALHAVGSELPRRQSMLVGWTAILLITAYTGIGAWQFESIGIAQIAFMLVATTIPLVLGQEVSQRRARIQAAEDRAERAEREKEERARQAVSAERARIARELHDVVSHQMAVMTLQAEGARRIAGTTDERVLDALDTIRDAGHRALDDMRRMVGVLRSDEADRAGLLPQPGLAQLDGLVEEMREAGLDVDLTIDGMAGPVPEGIALSVYRIVQESLTNAMKHGGPGVHADVRIAYRPDSMEVQVVDNGNGASTSWSESPPGHGLVGMQERVAILRGTLDAGPSSGGGFTVRATLPLDAG